MVHNKKCVHTTSFLQEFVKEIWIWSFCLFFCYSLFILLVFIIYLFYFLCSFSFFLHFTIDTCPVAMVNVHTCWKWSNIMIYIFHCDALIFNIHSVCLKCQNNVFKTFNKNIVYDSKKYAKVISSGSESCKKQVEVQITAIRLI